MTIKQCLNRNMKISKINDVYLFLYAGTRTGPSYSPSSSRTSLTYFKYLSARNLFNLCIRIAEIVPGFTDRSVALEPDFFQIIPNINLILQRMEYLYIENKVTVHCLSLERGQVPVRISPQTVAEEGVLDI